LGRVGAEPGIDSAVHGSYFDHHVSHFEVDSKINIVDFSDQRMVQEIIPPNSLQSFLDAQPTPSWARCRWIHVNGLNFDVIRRLGRLKRLHRLAIEDVFDRRTPTKVDWYQDHCFMVMPLQKLLRTEDFQRVPEEQRAENPLWCSPQKTDRAQDGQHYGQRYVWRTLAHESLGIATEQVSIFLTADNTVITLFERSGDDVSGPILQRLESAQSVVRTSNDPSMLVQAVIDAVVDLSMPIAQAATDTFGELELAVLKSPSIAQSKHLYILRSALTHFNDNMISTGGLLRTICDHNTAAIQPHNSEMAVTGATKGQFHSTAITISPATRVYLQDVQDHITALFTSTREQIRATENLTNLIFNTIAASQNESVRKLTLLSSFFLPLTFLTGYFGMNFDMPRVNDNSDEVFWWIATPVMLIAVVFLGPKPRFLRSLEWRSRRIKRARKSFDPNERI
jgi:Mg2+ and Co2+ transporter CorA